MTIRSFIVYFIIIASLSSSMIILNGCGKKVTTTRLSESAEAGVGDDDDRAGGVDISEAPVPGIDEPGEGELRDTSAMELSRLIKDVYFDFDRFLIREDAREILNDNAGFLKGKKVKKIVIEGHCDERGTSDYNLALGERRAESIKRYLTNLGIKQTSISTISFGKEKPFCTDHNEACWQKNRRGHFIVTQ